MPAQLARLLRRADFLRVAKGLRAPTPAFLLQARRRDEPAPVSREIARFGFTATRQLGGAVDRNRMRRRLREAVRQIAMLHAEPGYDYVLIARGGALKRPFAVLLDDLRVALRKVHRQEPPRSVGGG